MKTCYFCRGTIRSKKIEHVHRWGHQIFLLKDLPAEVCEDCGEVYFGPEALSLMDEAVTGKIPVVETIQIPVVSFASL